MDNALERKSKKRIRFTAVLFALLFALIAGKAFSLQVLQHKELVEKAAKQHQRKLKLTPPRGGIYDRSGIVLAESLDTDSLFADPKLIKEPGKTATLLAPILKASEQELLKKITADRSFVWLQRYLSPEVSERIRQMKLPGIAFVKESKRFYPNFETASHLIGFTGMDKDGLEGLERSFNDTLLGKEGHLSMERDALGRNVGFKRSETSEAVPGGNLHLTLDLTIQHIAEKELSKAVRSSGAKNGMIIVAEPATGKILALANYPTFNPNAFSRYNQQQLRNRVVADSFEPGSTLKTFVLAAALEEKLYSTSDIINCENGRYSFGGRIIRDDHPKGWLTPGGILKYSSNIGTAKIGIKLGDERLHHYLTSFGFGQKSGVELPGESGGLLRPPKRWYGSDIATISFGQSISVSALQLVAATSAVANGGILMKPYLLERVTDAEGRNIKSVSPQVVRRVISEDTAALVTRMMETVTGNGGTGTNAALEGVKVAGKTGTAQKADANGKGYSKTRRTASFVGFVPADKPLMTILVVIDEPESSPFGGVVAAPVFREVASNSLCYMKAISGVGKTNEICLPVNRDMTVRGTEETAQSAVSPIAGITLVDVSSPESRSARFVMPDFTGLGMRQVLQVMEKQQLNIQVKGSGKVVEQHPKPGELIQGAEGVWVRLAPEQV